MTSTWYLFFSNLILRRPLRRKVRMKWFFDISKVKESSFFNRISLTLHQIFDAHLLEITDLSPSRFHFSVDLISRSCFESDGFMVYSNEWDWREKTMLIHTNQPLMVNRSGAWGLSLSINVVMISMWKLPWGIDWVLLQETTSLFENQKW